MKTHQLALALPIFAMLGYMLGRSFSATVPIEDLRVNSVANHAINPPSNERTSPVGTPEFSGERATMDDIRKAFSGATNAERSALIDRALRSMDSDGLKDVFANYEQLSRDEQFLALPIAIGIWANVDPKAAAAWMKSAAETFRQGSETFRRVILQFADASPELANELLSELPAGESKASLQKVLLEKRAAKDMTGAIAVMESYPDGSIERREAGIGILQAIAIHRPSEMFGPFATEQLAKHPEKRETILRLMMMNLVKNGSPEVESIFDKLANVRERASMMNGVVNALGSSGLQRIGDYYMHKLATEPELATLFTSQSLLIQGIAKRDGFKAIQLAAALPESLRTSAELDALHQWAGVAPAKAMQWAEEQTDDRRRLIAIEQAFSGWAAFAATDAMEWLEKRAASKSKEYMTEIVVRELAAQGQHDRALDLVEKMSPSEQRAIAGNIASSLASTDPKLAAKWLRQIEMDQDIAHHYGRVAETWAGKDYKGAVAWIATLPASAAKDHAAARFAVTVAAHDPVVAGEWALTVAEPNIRAKAVRDVYSEWAKKDRASARQWALNSGVQQEQLKKIVR